MCFPCSTLKEILRNTRPLMFKTAEEKEERPLGQKARKDQTEKQLPVKHTIKLSEYQRCPCA